VVGAIEGGIGTIDVVVVHSRKQIYVFLNIKKQKQNLAETFVANNSAPQNCWYLVKYALLDTLSTNT
jgi:hypothetical protein